MKLINIKLFTFTLILFLSNSLVLNGTEIDDERFARELSHLGVKYHCEKDFVTFFNNCDFTIFIAAIFEWRGNFFHKSEFVEIEPKTVKKIPKKDLFEYGTDEIVEWKDLVFAKNKEEIDRYKKLCKDIELGEDVDKEYEELIINNPYFHYISNMITEDSAVEWNIFFQEGVINLSINCEGELEDQFLVSNPKEYRCLKGLLNKKI